MDPDGFESVTNRLGTVMDGNNQKGSSISGDHVLNDGTWVESEELTNMVSLSLGTDSGKKEVCDTNVSSILLETTACVLPIGP